MYLNKTGGNNTATGFNSLYSNTTAIIILRMETTQVLIIQPAAIIFLLARMQVSAVTRVVIIFV
jgi:hypothetical protein